MTFDVFCVFFFGYFEYVDYLSYDITLIVLNQCLDLICVNFYYQMVYSTVEHQPQRNLQHKTFLFFWLC